MTENTLNAVNEHCLDNVMRLAETNKVTTSEDVFDDHGNKLLAKGATINPAMKERLMRHKLHKPLETSLTVENGIDNKTILAEAELLLSQKPALHAFVGNERAAVLETLSAVVLEAPAALLLTTAAKNRDGSFNHCVLVALIASSIAVHQKVMTKRERALLATASLLHDIGEIYIDPVFLDRTRILAPHEWKHVIAHPKVAQVALSELTKYPKVVIDAVANHHERIDGSGYPRQLTATQIDSSTQILSLAESLSGILMHNEDPLFRSCLALKCIPGEYPRDLVSLISNMRRNYTGNKTQYGHESLKTLEGTHSITERLLQAVNECQRMMSDNSLPASAIKLLPHAHKRIDKLHQAMKASGINECAIDDSLLEPSQENHEILLEIDVIGREINWRMRDIARDLYIRLSNTAIDALPRFDVLIAILDNQQKH